MSVLTRPQVEHLAAGGEGLHVSLYMPTDRVGAATEQGPIRLKNLLTRVTRDLAARGVKSLEIAHMLEPAEEVVADAHFWQHQADGLAIFLTQDGMRSFRVPLAFPEFALVADRFHLKPLLPLLSGDGRFYLLALSLGRVRLFEGSRDTIRELDLEDVPESLRDVVGYDWEERSLQFHTGTGLGGEGGMRRAMFHGQGSPKDDDKPEIERFLRQVDEGIRGIIGTEHAPLVIAAVDYVADIYRGVTKYPDPLEETVSGNPDELSADELHGRAWPVVAPRFRERRAVAEARWQELLPRNRAGTDLREILRAAHDGRVETIWVAVGLQRWGDFDPDTRRITLHKQHVPGDRDLLDLAGIEALIRGADIFAVPQEEVPGGGAIAATFRY
jgi:hypothetical protein